MSTPRRVAIIAGNRIPFARSNTAYAEATGSAGALIGITATETKAQTDGDVTSFHGLRIYDLNANPTNPPQVGTWSAFYTHEVCVKTYTSGPYAGRQIAFCCSGLSFFQVSRLMFIIWHDQVWLVG